LSLILPSICLIRLFIFELINKEPAIKLNSNKNIGNIPLQLKRILKDIDINILHKRNAIQ
ncbi:MAG: hypothetical protein WC599_06155, partial [Bacteroidales bacterium]